MTSIDRSISQRLFEAFSPSPLQPGRDDDLYVDLESVRGNGLIVQRIVNGIRNADRPQCQLFSGHIGSGKSSELNRVADQLYRHHKIFAVVIKAEKDLDLNDADAPDVLIAVIRQLAESLRVREKIELRPTLLRARLDWLKEQLGKEVDLQGIELGNDLGKISATMRDSPSTRRRIRQLLEPDTANWLHAANDVISSARIELRSKGWNDLALLIDDLDRVVIQSAPDQARPRDAYLFIDRASVLSGLECHTVYNVPLSLERSVDGQRLTQLYRRGSIPVVPMVKLINPQTGMRHEPGVAAFREVASRRLNRAHVTESQTFAPGVLDRLIMDTGGQLRLLSTMVRDTLAFGEPPITLDMLERVERDIKRSFEHQLLHEHWEIIEAVRRTKWLDRTRENDGMIASLLQNRVILAYANDQEWYDVNPLVPPAPTTTKTTPSRVTPPAQASP